MRFKAKSLARRLLAVALLALVSNWAVIAPAQAQNKYYEPWKGQTISAPFEFGILSGMNLYGKEVNWSVLMAGAYLIRENGWADDLDDRVWVELQAGPSFFSIPTGGNQTGLQYSAHLRWDFTYNEYWTFYALGGLSGYSLPSGLGSSFTIHPRFGMGVEYQTKVALMFRAEVSAEFMGAGVGFNF